MITIDKWAGLVTNASPFSLPPGAAVTQVNLQIISPGQVTVRPGLATVSLGTVGGTVRSSMRVPGTNDRIIFQTADGVVRVSNEVT